MRLLLAIATACVLGCSSTTVTATPWGTVNGISFAPVDGFFLASAATNGDYNFIVFAVDQFNYCTVLQQNANAYLANMNVATFTYSNPVGTGQFDPALGTYPVTAAPGTSSFRPSRLPELQQLQCLSAHRCHHGQCGAVWRRGRFEPDFRLGQRRLWWRGLARRKLQPAACATSPTPSTGRRPASRTEGGLASVGALLLAVAPAPVVSTPCPFWAAPAALGGRDFGRRGFLRRLPLGRGSTLG